MAHQEKEEKKTLTTLPSRRTRKKKQKEHFMPIFIHIYCIQPKTNFIFHIPKPKHPSFKKQNQHTLHIHFLSLFSTSTTRKAKTKHTSFALPLRKASS